MVVVSGMGLAVAISITTSVLPIVLDPSGLRYEPGFEADVFDFVMKEIHGIRPE